MKPTFFSSFQSNAFPVKIRLLCAFVFALACVFVFEKGFASAGKMHSPVLTMKTSAQQKALPQSKDYYGVVLDIQEPARDKNSVAGEFVQQATVHLDTPYPVQGVTDGRVVVKHKLGENPALNTALKKGSRVLLTRVYDEESHNSVFSIINHDRTPALMILGSFLALCILLIGGVEVFKHTVLLLLMLTGCYKALFPAVLHQTTGANWIILMCFMFTILASFIYKIPGQKSHNKEQSVVVLGTLAGLLIMTVIMVSMKSITPLFGFSDEGLASMWYEFPGMDYWMLYLAGCLFGFQGLLFYLCWTLIQSRKSNIGERLGFKKRFSLVMSRGRRVLGPIISSVGLLALGLFMPILIQLQDTSTAQFVNLESTASALIFMFAGLSTLLLTVPVTAFLSGWLLEA